MKVLIRLISLLIALLRKSYRVYRCELLQQWCHCHPLLCRCRLVPGAPKCPNWTQRYESSCNLRYYAKPQNLRSSKQPNLLPPLLLVLWILCYAIHRPSFIIKFHVNIFCLSIRLEHQCSADICSDACMHTIIFTTTLWFGMWLQHTPLLFHQLVDKKTDLALAVLTVSPHQPASSAALTCVF